MPDKGGRYLIYGHNGIITTRRYFTHQDNIFFGQVVATHWMPLPELPKED